MIKKKYLILIAFAGFIVAFDQVTKIYIHTQFLLHESLPVIKNYFHITYVRNTGAAFGIFRDAEPVFRNIFFLSMPLVAVIIILTILHGLPEKEKLQTYALSAVCGGAIGNYIDRLRFGYVIDFLDFHIKNVYTWPAFNVADTAIVCGVMILIGVMIAQSRQEYLEKKAGKSSDLKEA